MAEKPSGKVPIPPGKVSYDVLRDCHKKAYVYLSEALQIDENGVGDKNAAIDYYSKGVSELEKGIKYDIHAEGEEELIKAESIKMKMKRNLEMAKDRVTKLLDGCELKGNSSTGTHTLPSESLFVMTKKNPRTMKKGNVGTTVPQSKVFRHDSKYNEGVGKISGDNKAAGREKDKHVISNNFKGVDSKLAQLILDELMENDTSVTWNDIVGLELPKRTLQEIVILPALRPELFTGLRSPARGLLLFGPPGNGKTMLAKAVAHESSAKFFNISSSSLTSKWVGEGEKLVRALFAVARELQPSVIFLDEVDALLSRRGESEHDAMRRLKNEFLLSFDGVGTSDNEKILVMAATNRPQELDDAALRRFEKRIYIPLPSLEARKTVLQKLLTKHKHTISDFEMDSIARACEGYSGSDLTALAKDAALGPIRDVDYETLRHMPAHKVRPMTVEDFEKSMHSVRSSVSPDLIKALEHWNTKYGVSA